jgi:hypothetical protein
LTLVNTAAETSGLLQTPEVSHMYAFASSFTLLTMRLPSDLWCNQMLSWLEEEDDDDNGQFYHQLDKRFSTGT